jgi:hypothetical protein
MSRISDEARLIEVRLSQAEADARLAKILQRPNERRPQGPPRTAGLGQFMWPNACKVAEVLIAQGLRCRLALQPDRSPRFGWLGR